MMSEYQESLNELIPWSELGIDSTDAKNGVEGLERHKTSSDMCLQMS